MTQSGQVVAGGRTRGSDGRAESLFSQVDLEARVGAGHPLLAVLVVVTFHSIHSERQLMERLDVDLSFRWFVGWGSSVWSGTTRPSPRTATGCSRAMARPCFLGHVLMENRDGLVVHPRGCRLRSRPPAEAHRSRRMRCRTGSRPQPSDLGRATPRLALAGSFDHRSRPGTTLAPPRGSSTAC